MTRIPLEDDFNDILSKAMSGLRLSDAELSRRTGVDAETIRGLARGILDETALLRVAEPLGLEPQALLRSAMKLYYPRPVSVDGMEMFSTPYHSGMRVNAFLVWDPVGREGVIFDTGTDVFPLLDRIDEMSLKIQGLFLTHTHPDHVAEAHQLTKRLGIPVRSNLQEPFEGAEVFGEWAKFRVGGISIEARTTWGHSRGGTTYVISGLATPVAVVGDALFAGSMGGGMVSYVDALANNRQKVFTLPDETVLCPGHGPMTTLAEEKRNNPFYAAAFKG